MMNLFKYSVGAIGALLALTICAYADQPARSWRAHKNDITIFLNAETHFKTKYEYDSYFRTVVVDAFRVSDIALIEGYPENLGEKAKRLSSSCQYSLDKNGRLDTDIRALTDLLGKTNVANFIPPEWAMLSPELFRVVILEDAQRPTIDHTLLNRKIIPAQILWPVGFELGMNTKDRPQVIEPLDDYRLLQEHFCSFPSSAKEDLFSSEIKGLIARASLLRAPNVKYSAAEISSALMSDYFRMLICAGANAPCNLDAHPHPAAPAAAWQLVVNDGSFDYYFRTRNKLWLARIMAVAEKHKKIFVSLGAAHVPDLKYKAKTYPGMLTHLRAAGFQVEPIATSGY